VGLFVAALDRAHHMKGLDRLLAAMAEIDIDLYLLVVGDGDMRLAYQAQARAFGLGSKVIFAGKVEHRSMPEFYRAADVTILPSFAESFGIVLIESMACATPVIASNVPGARTVVDYGRDGYYVDPFDIEDIAQKLRAIFELPREEREAMGRAGRRKVEARYRWEQIGELLEGFYGEIAGATSQFVASPVRPAQLGRGE
jgi:glycosyltransferase involved in cell wall biosynthesis